MLIKTIYNKSLDANPDKTILDSALEKGVVFEYSCKSGQCGICKTTLLDGEVTELQEQIALSEADRENEQILSCCCAPKTDILLDAEDLVALKNIETKIIPARINEILTKTNGINEIELRLPPASNFKFLEGQYIDVIGPGSVRRSYSIANSSRENTITMWIKKVEGGQLSNYWFSNAKQNDLLRIEGPKGTFFFRESKKPIIFLATGTGIAPVKAILDRLEQQNSKLKVFLCWGNRKPEEFFWQPEYSNLDLKYIPVLSREREGWSGNVGYVQNVALEKYGPIENTQVYACGSVAMIGSAKRLFINNGLDEKYFHSDAFVSS